MNQTHTDVLLVFCACGSRSEASAIAQALVEGRAAACVSIIPAVESVYRWEGRIETSQECLLLIKTTRERFPKLRDLIVNLHSYDVPEVIATVIEDGHEKYLAWVAHELA